MVSQAAPLIAIVAGEASGDNLGAAFMLALRERGLGSAWTSLSLQNERDISELLGIPYDDYSQAGLPWFEHTNAGKALSGSKLLAGLKSVLGMGQ